MFDNHSRSSVSCRSVIGLEQATLKIFSEILWVDERARFQAWRSGGDASAAAVRRRGQHFLTDRLWEPLCREGQVGRRVRLSSRCRFSATAPLDNDYSGRCTASRASSRATSQFMNASAARR
jgi:hypothetical protein